jgi:ribonuclease T2
MTSMLDLMPAPGLIYNEWRKHGTCSGLSPRAYFETIRKARAAVKIPEDYLQLSETRTVAPDEIKDAFVKANQGLGNDEVTVLCQRNRLSEVRICMNKDMQFRPCPEVTRQACRRDQVTMPPMRGG